MIAYPGMGDIVPGGFSYRPDGCQVVTTKYPHSEHEPIWTTAIYPKDAGHVAWLNQAVAMFEFNPGRRQALPLWVSWAPCEFEAGRNHEEAMHMEFPSPKKGANAWQRLIQDVLDIP